MADKPDAPKRQRTEGLDSEITLSFKTTNYMQEQLISVADAIGVSKSEAIRLAVIAYIKEKKGQYRDKESR